MSTDSEIRTERLRLLALTAGQLALLLNDPERLERELALTISREQLEDPVPRAIGMKLAKMAKADPKVHSWYTYWLIIVDRDAYGAGMIGFKGQPDARGEAEVGYGIDQAYRRQGYMTEAVQALIAWAFDDPTCLVVTAQKVLKSNIGSQRVLLNAGLHVILEEEDTQDWRIERPH